MSDEQLVQLYWLCHDKSPIFFEDRFLREDLASETFISIIDKENRGTLISGRAKNLVNKALFFRKQEYLKKIRRYVEIQTSISAKKARVGDLYLSKRLYEESSEEDPFLIEKIVSYLTRHKTFDEKDVYIFKEARQGKTSSKIAKELNFSQNTIINRLNKIKREIKENEDKVLSFNLKPNIEKVIMLNRKGLTVKQISEELGITGRNVRRIKKDYQLR